MATYRAYVINNGNPFRSAFLLNGCETDREAVAAAAQLVDDCEVEVWQLKRRVARLRPGEGKIVVETVRV